MKTALLLVLLATHGTIADKISAVTEVVYAKEFSACMRASGPGAAHQCTINAADVAGDAADEIAIGLGLTLSSAAHPMRGASLEYNNDTHNVACVGACPAISDEKIAAALASKRGKRGKARAH